MVFASAKREVLTIHKFGVAIHQLVFEVLVCEDAVDARVQSLNQTVVILLGLDKVLFR